MLCSILGAMAILGAAVIVQMQWLRTTGLVMLLERMRQAVLEDRAFVNDLFQMRPTHDAVQ